MPAWSRDGSRLAFVSGGEVFAINADGTGFRQVTNLEADRASRDVGGVSSPTWSPDGASLVFQEGPLSIDVVSAEGGEVTQLAHGYGPRWSPDGTRIAFQDWTASEGDELYTIGPDGTDLRQITEGQGDMGTFDWSPDGTRIAYSIRRNGTSDIDVVNADGTGHSTLVGTSADETWPEWSPDGEKIAYAVDPDALQNTEPQLFDLHVMHADGTRRTQLTTGKPVVAIGGLSWQPLPFAATPEPAVQGERGSPDHRCPSRGPFQAVSVPSSGPAGLTATVSGLAPVRTKSGRYVGPRRETFQVWWNADRSEWPSLLPGGDPPRGAGDATALLVAEGGVERGCSFALEFEVPPVSPGVYPLVVLRFAGRGYALYGNPSAFEVTSCAATEVQGRADSTTVKLEGDDAGGPFFAFGSVWVVTSEGADDFSLQRLDSETMEVRATIPLEGWIGGWVVGEDGFAAGGDSLWVAGSLASSAIVHRVDPCTNDVIATLQADGRSVGDVVVTDSGVWASVSGDDLSVSVARFDAATNQLIAQIPVTGEWIREILAIDDLIVVRTRKPETLTVIEASTNEVVVSKPSQGFYGPIAGRDGFIWANSGNALARIDPTTLEVIETIPVGSSISSTGLVPDGDAFWFVGYDASDETAPAALVRFNPELREVEKMLDLPDDSRAFTLGAGHLWVLGFDGRLTRIDLES
jgi:hypothetical protein